MREYTSPDSIEDGVDQALPDSLWEAASREPDRRAVAHREGDHFVTWTIQRFADEVRAAARGLIALGIEPGQRVAVLSPTRLEWTVLDYAIWTVGAVTTPIYEASSPAQIEAIVSDAQAVAIFLGSRELEERYGEVSHRLPDCRHALVLDDAALRRLEAVGRQVGDGQLAERSLAVTGDDVATIVYTSGTTGPPKGCVLTHRNLVWTAVQTHRALGDILRPGETTLLFLPLAHIFSRIIQVVCIRTGVVLGFATGLDRVREELGLFQPSFFLAVPRVFEKVLADARQQAEDAGKGRLFARAMGVAADASRQRAQGRVRPWVRLQRRLFDRRVYGRLREALGGRVRYAVSGGAPLDPEIGHVLDGIGVSVLEGYGLTETTAPVSVNRTDAHRIGTVGRPIPGVSVRVADDGEILVKGGNVFRGYHRNPDATADAFDPAGWFRTEDLGSLDDGFLVISGRKKEVIVTSGGKNVAPEHLEEQLRSHPIVGQAMVVGDGQPFIGALVSLDSEELQRWAQEHDRGARGVDELSGDRDLRREVQQAVDAANRRVSRAERIREFRILPDPLSVESGELTPTMKVRRDVVTERHQDLVDSIYAR